MKNTTNKVALITGANRGLGFETAKQLGEKGVTVVVAARQLSAAQDAAVKLTAKGIDAYAIQLDVTNATDRKAAAAYFESQFGRLDILVNNAGVGPKDSFVSNDVLGDATSEEFHRIFDTNVFSIVHLTHELMPLLKKSEAGRIVNLSSILGSLGIHAQEDSPISGFRTLVYNASKTALNMVTVQLANELKGTNIKVNSAHPGWVKTDMGTDAAPMEIVDGAKTSVDLALIDAEGPHGKFIHLGEELAW